ncbi:type IV secretory system conjugative DNA transfer family protein [Streptomyces sp. NPDC059477]|uniref:type IV secretory system conjugative DNA transfer family protein n=1 Tax=Streptomyces sp. NPDC059477 TaxID=3346847 RepID=UPI003683A4A1
MRRDDHRQDGRDGQGGIPDGLLVGLLAFLLGMTVLVWTATGLAGLFTHGAWPQGVTFGRTPLAIRQLVAEPHDIAGAWPDTPATQLTGYGLFWGLFIGQLMVLVVLTVFVLGTTARWKAGRDRRRTEARAAATKEAAPPAAQRTYDVPTPRPAPEPAPTPPLHPTSTGPSLDKSPTDNPTVAKPTVDQPAMDKSLWEQPVRDALLFEPPERRRTTAAQAVRDAEGAALVVTSDPAVWQDTKDARAKLGPVLLYDPTHRCDTPARLHWSPTAGCEDKATAAERATALLAPVRPTAKLDQAVADTAETLLRSCLHAAALDGRTVRHVHRWAQGNQIQDAVRTLRTHPKAAPGAAGELEAALTSHPERRDIAQELAGRALSSLFTVNVREACTPNRADALALDSFVHEGGTLYVVGESIEDPRANPAAMPLLTALVSSVVERGRRMAERSSSGRLDPPLTLVLDDIAAVAPIPALPALLTHGTDRGLPTLALLRSREQARSRWPGEELPVR